MKIIICSSVFFVVYFISIIIFYYLDFFKIKDCRGNALEPDWGKILGYALLPSFILSLVSYMICANVKSYNRRSRLRFDDYDEYMPEFEGHQSNYSCGMGDY
jgi:hypothetical protein